MHYHLDEAMKREELSSVAVYFLVGPTEEDGKLSLYIGEAEDGLKRLQQHNRAKDFWTHAIVVRSKTHYFTKTHIKYLESFCYKEAKKAGRFDLVNTNIPTEPHISEPLIADLLDNYETMKILVSTLGYPIFDKIRKPPSKDVLVCVGKDASGEGRYTEDGLVVFAGAKCRVAEAKGMGVGYKKIRQTLAEKGILTVVDETSPYYTLTTDYLFNSPSAAAVFILGRSANGWTEWKTKEGRTLDELKRKI